MVKSAILFTALALFSAPHSAVSPAHATPPIATFSAQFSFLSASFGEDGLDVTVSESSDMMIDIEFRGDRHIKIGF